MFVAGTFVVVLMSIAAAAFDVRTRRIPNWLTASLAIVGVGLQCVVGGPQSGLTSFGLVLLAICVGTVFHAAGIFGGGDIKFLAGGLSFVGPSGALFLLVVSALCGGILALVMSVKQRRLVRTLRQLSWAITVPACRLAPDRGYDRIPYAVAICAGILIGAFFRTLPTTYWAP